MMNGDQPKMDALTPMIGQALNVRDQLRVEMGNQMGLGSDGWASQGKSYTGSYETQLKNKDEITEFVKKVKEAEANIPADQGMYGLSKGSAPIYEKVIPVTEIPTGQSPFDDAPPIWGPYIIDPNKKREDIKEFLLSDDGDQSKPRGGGGFNNPLGMNGYRNSRVQFAANDNGPMMGLNDEVMNGKVEEYPPEPSPPSIPGRPPVPEDHPDMKNYDEGLKEIQEEHDEWEEDVARIDDAITQEKEEERIKKEKARIEKDQSKGITYYSDDSDTANEIIDQITLKLPEKLRDDFLKSIANADMNSICIVESKELVNHDEYNGKLGEQVTLEGLGNWLGSSVLGGILTELSLNNPWGVALGALSEVYGSIKDGLEQQDREDWRVSEEGVYTNYKIYFEDKTLKTPVQYEILVQPDNCDWQHYCKYFKDNMINWEEVVNGDEK